jgi:hypothetical protein
MKKLTISLLAIIFSFGAALSQPVSDQGIIPVGVTLNSILRLNITSGGNIEYVVNTIDQYTNGIAANPLYQTHFTVASSVDFDVDLYADAATFIGVDDVANTIPLDNLGYECLAQGTGVDAVNWDLIAGIQPLTNAAALIIASNYPGLGAGDINQNDFRLEWRLGTSEGTMNATSLLQQSITSDRYVVNVILDLSQH